MVSNNEIILQDWFWLWFIFYNLISKRYFSFIFIQQYVHCIFTYALTGWNATKVDISKCLVARSSFSTLADASRRRPSLSLCKPCKRSMVGEIITIKRQNRAGYHDKNADRMQQKAEPETPLETHFRRHNYTTLPVRWILLPFFLLALLQSTTFHWPKNFLKYWWTRSVEMVCQSVISLA